MANPASTADIEARWRPLTSAEETIAETRLEDGWRELRRLVPDLEARMVGDVDLTATVVEVLADATIRLLSGLLVPQGLKRTTVAVDDASRSVEYDRPTVASFQFTDGEIEKLSLTASRAARAYSVSPI